ncbi:hypothetical protein [Streptomyces sp. BBFR102]|uniref:hypothetical protein n=1 Tax=Streptomyces sp. BBFR102 TaxID=3448171 RepID=UPI003F529625
MSNDSSALLGENATWQALQGTPLGEIRRRAALVAVEADVEPTEVDGAERLAWNDGGGQSAVWYFTADGRALLLTFDHEGSLNLYAEGDYALQVSLYEGVPDALVALVRDRPENYESLNLTDPDSGATIHYAGGVFWFDGAAEGGWRIADGLAAYCEREKIELNGEAGFSYCLAPYHFGEEFPEPGRS